MPTLKELSGLIDGELRGDAGVAVLGVASLESAGPGDIAPVDSLNFVKAAHASKAAALLVKPDLADQFDRPCLLHEHPLVALNRVMEALGMVRAPAPGVHPTAALEGAVHETATAAAFAVVQPGARVGPRTALGAHVVVESGAVVGADCILEAGAVVCDGAVIGDRVRVGANAVISRQGFGFAAGPDGPVHLHHIGRVVIEDDVKIGAGTMIDRARFDETRIGASAAIDNLVQIAHNSTVGARTFLAAQVGLAGNAFVGSDCLVAGQVGFANGCGVGDRSQVGAKAGVIKRWGDDSDLAWIPATPRRIILRKLAAFLRE